MLPYRRKARIQIKPVEMQKFHIFPGLFLSFFHYDCWGFFFFSGSLQVAVP